jgi:hypothetical protein
MDLENTPSTISSISTPSSSNDGSTTSSFVDGNYMRLGDICKCASCMSILIYVYHSYAHTGIFSVHFDPEEIQPHGQPLIPCTMCNIHFLTSSSRKKHWRKDHRKYSS